MKDKFLTAWDEWKQRITDEWAGRCAFPGCIHSGAPIIIEPKIFDFQDGICACIYHRKIVRELAYALINERTKNE